MNTKTLILILIIILLIPTPVTHNEPIDEAVGEVIKPEVSYVDSGRQYTIHSPSPAIIEEEVAVVDELSSFDYTSQETVVVSDEEIVETNPLLNVELPYPEYITVRVTGVTDCDDIVRHRLIEVPFKDYVKGVLANEWGHMWHEESLKAGAISVKMFAWDAVLNGGKYGGYKYGIVYDCDWDMVYNPAITRDSTDKAVDDTWDVYVTEQDGTPMRIHFLAWYGACVNWLGSPNNCIGQWNSKQDAENGMTYKEILHKYLTNPIIVTHNYRREMEEIWD